LPSFAVILFFVLPLSEETCLRAQELE
jgi:hypothetical protein